MRAAGPAQRISIAIERRAVAVVIAVVIRRVGAAQQRGVEDSWKTAGALKKKLLRLFRVVADRVLPGIELIQDFIADAEASFVDHCRRQGRSKARRDDPRRPPRQ